MYFGKIDGVAGPMTAKGLRTFQRLTRLPVTGELGPRTRAELGALGRPLVARRVLVQGAYGWDVSALQFLLARAGHLRLLDVDGHFGASTKAALVRFQKTRGLAVDGIAGPASLTAFGSGRRAPVLTRATAAPVSYVVKPGDTLTEIAVEAQDDRARAREGERPEVGQPRRRGREAAPARGGREPARRRSCPARPFARTSTSGRTTTASPVSLARALAWQESGFQTNITSSVGAWGPMQVIPSTWAFVETVVLGHTVPKTGEGGVEVGMALLNHLLKRFNGDQRLALAAWYQGEKAVREIGIYDETKAFVANVLALAGRPL